MNKIVFLLFLVINILFSKEYYMGLVFDDKEYQNTPTTAKLLTRDLEFLPPSVSLKAYAPTVGNQGRTGTCTSWATAYGARTILESINKNRKYSHQTDSAVFSPSYIYNQIRRDRGCKNGTNIGRALRLIEYQGVAKLNKFAFNCNKIVTNKDKRNAKAYRIKDYKTLFTLYDTNKIQPVKKALSQKNPVIIGMRTPKSFSYAKDIWQPTQNDYYKRKLGGHAMVVIGYDDNKYGGSFQLMNSWGTEWGNNGFTWIRYRDFKYFVKYAYEMIPNPPPQEPIRLGGELKFMDLKGNEMRATYNNSLHFYQMNRPYKSGTRFNFFMKNAQPAYLYAFGLDSAGKISTIFPHNSQVSAFLGYRNSTIAFPSETKHIRMDNHVGKDYFIILYSKNKLDINNIKRLFYSCRGSVTQRLKAVLGNRLINNNNINFFKNSIKFNYISTRGIRLKKNNNKIISVIIEFNHI